METLQTMLTKASEILGVAVDNLYTVLIQQAKVELVWNTITLVVGIVAIITLLLLTKKWWKMAQDNYELEFLPIVGGVLSFVSGVMYLIYLPELTKECVQIMFNPPVWVLEYLTQLVK